MLFRYELRRFRRGLPLLALIFVLLVPAIYGALYLSANWDPYGRMDRLPVAIVNEDRPVELDGATLTTGADVTRQLVDDHAFDWHETTRTEAEEGLREGRYYLVLEIPEQLSADLISPTTEDTPQQAHITLRRDDSNGYVIGSVTASSQSKIENAVDQAAVEAYFTAVFDNLRTLREGMVDAADGAAQLAEGAGTAHEGSGRLRDGVGQAEGGSRQVAEGAASAAQGSQQLAAGAAAAQDGADRLAAGAAAARDGSQQLVDGTAAAQAGSQQLAAGAAAAQDGADRLATGAAAARDGSQQLVDGTAAAQDGSRRIADGADALAANAPALREGALALQDGLDRLDTGAADLSAGARQVAGGTQELYDTVVPTLEAVGERQDRVAEDVAAVDGDVQRITDAVGAADGGLAGGIETARAQLDALAEEEPALAESDAYASLQASLAAAAERADTVSARAQEAAETSAAVNGRVQSAVAEDKVGTAADTLTRLNDGAHAVADGADQLGAGIGEAKQGAGALGDGVVAFSDGLEQLSSGAADLDDGLGRLHTGASDLHDGLGTLSTGATDLSDGVGRLATGATDLDDGLGRLATGAADLHTGLAQLREGSGSLDDGLASLDEGAHTLATRLDEGAQQIPAISEEAGEDAALVMSQPVKVDMDVQNAAEKYGRGMAPLFFSIALWVFGIAAFNVMRPVSGRMLAGRRNPVALALSAWLPVGLLAMGGGLIMLTATLPLGMAPVHPARMVLLVLVTAAVFSLIAHLLQTALGTPASAVLLVLLILQLASTGGTYPSAVLPGFFQALHPFMPMTYSIEAFRQATSGGLDSHFWGPMLLLLAVGAVALLLDVAVVRGRQRFRLKDLHPALDK